MKFRPCPRDLNGWGFGPTTRPGCSTTIAWHGSFVRDVVEWDVANWSHAVKYWEARAALHAQPLECMEFAAHHGGLSLWLASLGHQVDYRTAGFLGAFGRSETQRRWLSAFDGRALASRVPEDWCYIMYGIATK
jgi:hypothetical protein